MFSTPEPLQPDGLRALVSRWLDQVQRGRDPLTLLEAAAHPDIVVHMPDGAIGGLDAWRQYRGLLGTAFPDLVAEVVSISVADDRILIQLELQGTHTGPLDFVAATNRRVTASAAMVSRVDTSRRVVELWAYANMGAAIFRR
jgi:predicted ester cyclase